MAPVSGVRLPSPCPTTRPVPLLTIHGTFDLTDPYQGHGQYHWTYSVPTAVALWGAHDGCSGPRATALPGLDTVVSTYARCPAGVSVELYTVVGSGHEWPGSAYNVEPPTTQVLQANNVIWAFFAAHPMA